MDAIDSIIDDVLRAEGGYVNNPNDTGGETHYGITVAVARANGYTGLMRDLPRDLARQIYRRRYVEAPGFDRVAAVSLPIALEVIDTGVNMGPSRAGEYLQRWLNGFNVPGSGYQDLFVDGNVGPVTVQALQRYIAKRGNEGINVLLRGLNSTQGNRYLELTEARPSQREFLYGWVRARVQVPA